MVLTSQKESVCSYHRIMMLSLKYINERLIQVRVTGGKDAIRSRTETHGPGLYHFTIMRPQLCFLDLLVNIRIYT